MEMKKICCFLSGAALVFGLSACGNDHKTTSESAPASESSAVAEAPAAPSTPGAISGKVLETMDASGYTYVSLDDGSGKEIWAAIPKSVVAVGEEVTLQGGSVMNNFSSKTLDRTFESIIFASGIVRGGEQTVVGAGDGGSFDSAVAGEGAAAGASGGSEGNVVEFADLKIEKAMAANAQTVGDIFAGAATLDTQKVSIKGQVVKVSKNIMGKNWLHIQDGTGDPAVNSHDLVVTTADVAEKGAVVTVEGTVAANKDFGSGYRYDVIVEDAVVKQ